MHYSWDMLLIWIGTDTTFRVAASANAPDISIPAMHPR
jgi:hypothetical protein